MHDFFQTKDRWKQSKLQASKTHVIVVKTYYPSTTAPINYGCKQIEILTHSFISVGNNITRESKSYDCCIPTTSRTSKSKYFLNYTQFGDPNTEMPSTEEEERRLTERNRLATMLQKQTWTRSRQVFH